MGGGIAMVFANAGIPVLLKETDQAALDRGMNNIRKNYADFGKARPLHQQFVDERLKLITPTLTYDGFADADMVIEAAFEGMALKKANLRRTRSRLQTRRNPSHATLHTRISTKSPAPPRARNS